MRTRRAVLAALLAALAVLAQGCSGGPGGPGRSAAPSGPPSATPSSPAAAGAGLDWQPCERGFSCADLTVPLGDGTTLPLAVTRRPAPGPGTRLGVLLVNPGGPGASAVDFAQAAYGQLPADVRARFDVVAYDPRGVGRSRPVRCVGTAALDAYVHADPDPDDAAEETALEQQAAAFASACGARDGAVLAHVSTADAAEDIDRVRAALGEQRISYLGYSYGTALGAAYLAAHPDRVRAMVLDGALDPALTWDALLEGQSRGFDAALAAFLADCEQVRCAFRSAVTGDLGAAYDALAARVDNAPLPVGERSLGPGELSLGVAAGLYDRASWPTVAQALAGAQRGAGRELLALSDAYLERGTGGYSPVFAANLAVSCIDRPWPREPGPYVDLARRLRATAPRFGPAIALASLPCATWPARPVSTPGLLDAPGAPTVVVLGTTGDPATPYAWSQALVAQLPGSVLLTHRGQGHTVYRVGAPDCIVGPVDAYLVDGTRPAAATC